MGIVYSKADPYYFHKWLDRKLLVMLLLVWDFNFMEPRDMVMKAKEELKSMFKMKDVGEMDEYVGCHIKKDQVKQSMRFTQPVKVQRIQDDYDQGITKGTPNTPMEPGSVLKKEGVGINDQFLDSICTIT